MVDKAPDVVAFQLKRFTTLDGSIVKIDKHVGYPLELDLQPFHSNPDKEVDSISETSALGQEAYILFYVRQGRFLWFSSMQEDILTPPPRPKRMYSVNDHNAFSFENLDEKDTSLISMTEHQTKVKKPKAASASKDMKSSSLDENASRLRRGMMSARRKCFVKRLDSMDHNASLGY